jgi:hypothetical protein
MRTLIGCAVFAAVCALSLAAPAFAGPFAPTSGVKSAVPGDAVEVAAVRRKHPRRAYVEVPVRPPASAAAPGCPGLYSWNPANPDRGFCDPGFAYHGNVNGCAIDQGYGRWAPCTNLR